MLYFWVPKKKFHTDIQLNCTHIIPYIWYFTAKTDSQIYVMRVPTYNAIIIVNIFLCSIKSANDFWK